MITLAALAATAAGAALGAAAKVSIERSVGWLRERKQRKLRQGMSLMGDYGHGDGDQDPYPNTGPTVVWVLVGAAVTAAIMMFLVYWFDLPSV